MGNIDQALLDKILSYQLDLLRLDAGTRQEVLKILTRMQQELVAKLANTDLTDYGKRRLQVLLKECSDVIDRYYLLAQGELDLTIQGVGLTTSQHTIDALAEIATDPVLPSATFFRQLVSSVLVNAAPIADWWERQKLDTMFKFSNAVRQGLAQAETNQQIIARVAGKRGFPGIMDIARHNAAALVQTSVQAVANAARKETFQKNADVIGGLIWMTALDGHVCPLCAARADLEWTLDGEPVGHSIPYQDPPIHFNDRCILVPRTQTFAELGIDLPDYARKSTRASADGQVKGTFADYLKRQGTAFQDEVLGPGRAQLWRDGTITLQDLLNLTGNPLTLKQLRAKYT